MMARLSWRLAAASACLAGLAPGCAAGGSQRAILKVLDDQVAAWNAGDIDGFMKGYWQSEELTFVSVTPAAATSTPARSNGSRPAAREETTRGWHATRERYKRKYSTKAEMGRLSFEDLAIARFEGERAEVHGRYRVERAADVLTGRFVLDMRVVDERWVIVRDRTTSDPPSGLPAGRRN